MIYHLSHFINLRESKNEFTHERRYIDFEISRKALSEILNIESTDLVTNFGWGSNSKYELELLDELILKKKTELKNGRTMLYVCPECGDIGCGAITMKIERKAGNFVWHDFASDDGNFDTELDLEEFKKVGPFEFEKNNYYKVIKNIRRFILNQ